MKSDIIRILEEISLSDKKDKLKDQAFHFIAVMGLGGALLLAGGGLLCASAAIIPTIGFLMAGGSILTVGAVKYKKVKEDLNNLNNGDTNDSKPKNNEKCLERFKYDGGKSVDEKSVDENFPPQGSKDRNTLDDDFTKG